MAFVSVSFFLAVFRMNAVTFMGVDLISGLNTTKIVIVPNLFPIIPKIFNRDQIYFYLIIFIIIYISEIYDENRLLKPNASVCQHLIFRPRLRVLFKKPQMTYKQSFEVFILADMSAFCPHFFVKLKIFVY